MSNETKIKLVIDKHYMIRNKVSGDKWVEVIYKGKVFDPYFHWPMAVFEELSLGAEWAPTEAILEEGKNIKEIE